MPVAFGATEVRLSTKAVSVGVVYSRATGQIVRVLSPDYEEELDLHHVGDEEFMLRVEKQKHGISTDKDAMTTDDLFRLIEALS